MTHSIVDQSTSQRSEADGKNFSQFSPRKKKISHKGGKRGDPSVRNHLNIREVPLHPENCPAGTKFASTTRDHLPNLGRGQKR
jgi:hypothetical protein